MSSCLAKMSASMAAFSARPPGCKQRFGPERVLDTPLAELLISGLCVGMAAQGLKPVGEIQFMGFLYPCIDQLVNHASRMRNRTQGRLTCPMVLRTPHGAGIRAPEHHSESTEAMLAHIPGLRVVIPSSPERAYGLAPRRDPRSRSGGVSGANAHLPRGERRGGRQRRSLAAGCCLCPAGRPRRHADQLGRDGEGNHGGRRCAGCRGHRCRGHRSRHAQAL